MILYHSPTNQQLSQDGPTTPSMQRLPALTHTRFSLLRFRSPLLTESQLFSLPVGTEMFHFPTFPPTTLYIQVEVAGHNSGHLRGFPIRTSTDQSSFTNSPWLIAGYNVLHRLLMPRHPPIALSSLSPKKLNNKKLQRCSRPLYNSQPTRPQPAIPHTKQETTNQSPHPNPTNGGNPGTQQRAHPPTITHPTTFHTHPPTTGRQAVLTIRQTTTRELDQCFHNSSPRHPHTTRAEAAPPHPHAGRKRQPNGQGLPRKEVIQPHLPVRLPCYDLVLITDPTFDGSPHKG